MATVTESVLSPTELFQAFARGAGEFQLLSAWLFQVLDWFRGDVRLGQSAASLNNIVASTTAQIDIQPPDNNEEWGIMAATISDTAAIDPNDRVNVLAIDQVTGIVQVLQSSLVSLAPTGLGVSGNTCVWPNRDTASPLFDLGNSQPYFVTARRKDKTTGYLSLRIQYRTTATVGTRTVQVNYLYTRRRLV